MLFPASPPSSPPLLSSDVFLHFCVAVNSGSAKLLVGIRRLRLQLDPFGFGHLRFEVTPTNSWKMVGEETQHCGM